MTATLDPDDRRIRPLCRTVPFDLMKPDLRLPPQRVLLVAVPAAIAVMLTVGAFGSSSSDNGARAVDAATVEMAEVAEGDLAAFGRGDAAGHGAGGTGDGTVDGAGDGLPDLDGESLTIDGECVIGEGSLGLGSTGDEVGCLQLALTDAGLYSGALTGVFDEATFAAVRELQTVRDLFVDGVVGRETARSLGIWLEEESFVVRTPVPAPGALDLLGYPLSSVAASGPDAPPLPDGSGSGKRVVYERQGQRVWAVDANDRVIRSWLVSGSIYANELPGTHYVYSRSEQSWAWNMEAELPLMVRWLRTERGHIGFHGIPVSVADGTAYQTESELGTRLSGGCQRQANLDAAFLWDFAPEGTKVVVL